MVNYYSIQAPTIHTLEINKSKFITYLFPVKDEEEVTYHLQALTKEHYKANHRCYAYILHSDASVQRMSDDGEPSQTAGVPMLEVLKRNQLTYILAVTVRYFGGIKLGAGGLIRAYSNSVSEALSQSQIVANTPQMLVAMEIDYSQIDNFNYFMHNTEYSIQLQDTTYTDKVLYELALYLDEVNPILDELTNRFNGQLDWLELGQQTINVPVPSAHQETDFTD